MKNFTIQASRKILVTINGMPHQLYAGGLQARDIYPELKEYSGRGGCYDQSVFDRIFNIYFAIKATHLFYIFLKHITSFW